MEGKTKIYIFVFVIIALIILSYYVYKSSTKQTTVTAGGATTTQTQSGGAFAALTALSGFLGGLHLGNNLSGPGTVNCDPNRPGFEMDGTYNANCAKDYTGCKPGVCDPKRAGFDECGIPSINC